MKHKILNNRENKYGYILNNFPETIQQANNLFNLEKLILKRKNNTHVIKDDMHPSIIKENV